MSVFMPTNPHDWGKTQAQKKVWEDAERDSALNQKIEKRRFIISCLLSGIAALAAVAGVIIQLVKG